MAKPSSCVSESGFSFPRFRDGKHLSLDFFFCLSLNGRPPWERVNYLGCGPKSQAPEAGLPPDEAGQPGGRGVPASGGGGGAMGSPARGGIKRGTRNGGGSCELWRILLC